MKPLLFLLLAGCAFGQHCATCALTVEPPEMPQSTCGLVVNGKPSDCRLPVKKKPAGQKPAKPPFQCDHSKLQSCASQANDDYGPGRSGLVGELTPEMVEQVKDSIRIHVPAIQETRKVCFKQGIVNSVTGGTCDQWGTENVITCKDKARVLEHDEQEPLKYWCHRVQP